MGQLQLVHLLASRRLCSGGAGVDALAVVCHHGLDQALGQQLLDSGAREAAANLQHRSIAGSETGRGGPEGQGGRRGAAWASHQRRAAGGAGPASDSGQPAAESAPSQLTLRRSERMEVVIILYLGTSAISLS